MELYTLTAGQLREKLAAKEISSVELTAAILSRVEEKESAIKSFLFIDAAGAKKQARNFDIRLSKEGVSPGGGIPIAIKDNICLEGAPTTCASKILGNFNPVYNAHVVEELIKAESVFIGKTNLDEFAMGSSTENSAFKTTSNPWDISRVPGGSSGGSAAAVAVGEAVWAIGSDTGGSIRQPASFCGIVGLKPTYGLVSRYGLVAFASSLDQIGPLTRDVADAAELLQLIAGHDERDSTSVLCDIPNYKDSLDGNIQGLKVGVPRELFRDEFDAGVRERINEAILILEKLGASVEETSLSTIDYALSAYYLIAPAEASSNLARFDGVRYGYRSEQKDDIVEMYSHTRAEGFGAEVKRRIMLGTYALSAGYYDAYYGQAQKVRSLIIKDFADAFSRYDVMVSPTTPTTAFKIGEKTDDPLQMYLSDICTIPMNLAGLPAISIPCGTAAGLPVGLQIIGRHFDEAAILNVAYALETEIAFSNKPLIDS